MISRLLIAIAFLCTGCVSTSNSGVKTHDGAYDVRWSLVDIDTIPVDEYFAVEATVTPAPASMTIDAVMPSHRHGMLNDATMEQLNADTWVAHDMLFHMHGHWRFRFDVTDADGVVHRAEVDVDIE